MMELSDLEKAFCAVKTGQCCKELLTPSVLAGLNECYEGDFLLSAAVEVYLKKPNASLHNIKLLLEHGANPLCGSWSRDGVYVIYLNLNAFVAAHLSNCHFGNFHLQCLEIAAMLDRLDLVMLLVACPQINPLHVKDAARMALSKSDSRFYLTEVMEQFKAVEKMMAANAPTRYYHQPAAKGLLNMAPLAPILVLKGVHNNCLEEIAEFITHRRRSLRDVRAVFFNRQSTAFSLPLEMVRLTASYLVNFSPLESKNLRVFGDILDRGFLAETYFSKQNGFRCNLPYKPRAVW